MSQAEAASWDSIKARVVGLATKSGTVAERVQRLLADKRQSEARVLDLGRSLTAKTEEAERLDGQLKDAIRTKEDLERQLQSSGSASQRELANVRAELTDARAEVLAKQENLARALADIASKEEEITRLNARIAQLESDIVQLRSTHAAELLARDSTITSLEDERRDAIKDIGKEIETLADKLDALQASLNSVS